jgi:DNA-directed RNA polymerase specialized sigma24 family protein
VKSSKESREILEDAAHALRRRNITADEFLRRTGPRWRATAAGIYARYRAKLPDWVERQDVEQELMMQVLRHVRKWRPARASISAYVLFASIHRTQRVLDGWRGASTNGNSGKNPGHVDVAFSRLDGRQEDGGDDFVERQAAFVTDPIDRIDTEEEFARQLDRCRTVRQALVAIAMRATEGSVERASELLYRNARARVECGILHEQHAVKVVRDVLDELENEVADVLDPPPDLFDAIEFAALEA